MEGIEKEIYEGEIGLQGHHNRERASEDVIPPKPFCFGLSLGDSERNHILT